MRFFSAGSRQKRVYAHLFLFVASLRTHMNRVRLMPDSFRTNPIGKALVAFQLYLSIGRDDSGAAKFLKTAMRHGGHRNRTARSDPHSASNRRRVGINMRHPQSLPGLFVSLPTRFRFKIRHGFWPGIRRSSGGHLPTRFGIEAHPQDFHRRQCPFPATCLRDLVEGRSDKRSGTRHGRL